MLQQTGYFLDRTCLKHGKHTGYFSLHVPEINYASQEFCMLCIAEKLKELGVCTMTTSTRVDDFGNA